MSSSEEHIDSSSEESFNNIPKECLRKSKRKQSIPSSGVKGRQNKRVVKSNSEIICPVCHLTLRGRDIQDHFRQELEKLSKFISMKWKGIDIHKERNGDDIFNASLEMNGSSSPISETLNSLPSSSSLSADILSQPSTSGLPGPQTQKKQKFKEPGHESFKSVKMNRLLRQQFLKWKARDIHFETICPVCEEPVPVETTEELQIHADKCLKKQEGQDNSIEESEEEDGEDLIEGDEYEWCGMKRIRLTSLLKSQGRLNALGTMVKKGDENEDVEVCLVPEEEDEFGPPQYSQEDLQQASNDVSSETECFVKEAQLKSSFENDSQKTIVEALEFKIRELEDRDGFICHVCHGQYVTPVVSISCWHVHCEKCWLQALSSQKLCPQCKSIVSPSELRRIYL